MQKEIVRKFFAIIVVSLVPAVLMVLGPVLVSQSWPYNESDYKIIFVTSTIVSFLSVVFIGMPIMLLLKKRQQLTLLNWTMAGGLAGAAVFMAFTWLLGSVLGSSVPVSLSSAVWGCSLGFMVSIVFGLIWGLKGRQHADNKK